MGGRADGGEGVKDLGGGGVDRAREEGWEIGKDLGWEVASLGRGNDRGGDERAGQSHDAVFGLGEEGGRDGGYIFDVRAAGGFGRSNEGEDREEDGVERREDKSEDELDCWVSNEADEMDGVTDDAVDVNEVQEEELFQTEKKVNRTISNAVCGKIKLEKERKGRTVFPRQKGSQIVDAMRSVMNRVTRAA
jgi:hypothetical protein